MSDSPHSRVSGPSGAGASENPTNAAGVIRDLLKHPFHFLVVHWNWKAALTSTILRGSIFYATNLSSGQHAALGALEVDAAYRILTVGFYGAIIQAFRRAEPAWQGMLAVALVLPAMNHVSEFLVHWLHGTPHVALGVSVSVLFTILSTLFNLFAMRRGVFVVGRGSQSLWSDFAQVPALVAAFLAIVPLSIWRLVRAMIVSMENQNPGG